MEGNNFHFCQTQIKLNLKVKQEDENAWKKIPLTFYMTPYNLYNLSTVYKTQLLFSTNLEINAKIMSR